MQNLDEQEKKDLLRQVLIELSKSQDILKKSKNKKDYFLRLEKIYYNTDSDNFRHFYSDIFACVSLIDADDSLGNLDILAQNMQVIKDGYIPKNIDGNGNQIDIHKEIIKLYDHTNLDISRINYTKRMTGETKSDLMKARSIITDLQKKQVEAQSLISSLQERLIEAERIRVETTEHLNSEAVKLKEEVHDGQKKMQNEYITILGIFAAIVLAFTSGMTFSSSVLENIDKASAYRILAIVLILGLIIFNLIWLLIDFLRDINGKSIRKWWIVLVVNALFVGSLIFTFAAYHGHWLGS